MARQTRQFRIERHPEFGNIGLAPDWMPDTQADPLVGMGCAHDVLEHGDSDECEWQGLGGAVYVRATSGYFSKRGGNPDPADNIGADFVELFNLWEGQPIPDPGRTYPCDEDGLIQDCVERGCELVRSEIGKYGDQPLAARMWTNAEQKRRMVGWMRRGYRSAAKRWAKYGGYDICQTFIAIEKAVDRFLVNDGESYEGGTCTLTFDIEENYARVDYNDEGDY